MAARTKTRVHRGASRLPRLRDIARARERVAEREAAAFGHEYPMPRDQRRRMWASANGPSGWWRRKPATVRRQRMQRVVSKARYGRAMALRHLLGWRAWRARHLELIPGLRDTLALLGLVLTAIAADPMGWPSANPPESPESPGVRIASLIAAPHGPTAAGAMPAAA